MNALVGDIGGTKTILAIFSPDAGPRDPLLEATFSSPRYTGLEDIIVEFLAGTDLPVDRACFAIAGPIRNGRCQLTNLSWVIDAAAIQERFNFSSVTLLNDLESVAYAIPILEDRDIVVVNAGTPLEGAPIAVLAPGTGLGEAYLTHDGGRYVAHASEGSHASFAPENELQMGLLRYLKGRGYGHVSFECVCSGGSGIPLLYEYLKSIGIAEEPVWLSEQLAGGEDPTPLIFAAARNTESPCELARATLRLFVEILGAEAGNQVLKILSMGGLYLGGGITPRILDELKSELFLEPMRDKGRFRKLLTEMPVYAILDAKAGLIGAAGFELGTVAV